MTMVADRLFPRASPRLVGSLEVLAGGALVSGLLGFAWMYTTGG
jgi:hypothetical protein